MAVKTSTSAGVDIVAALDLPAVGDPSQVAPKDARAVGRVFFDRLQNLEEGTHEYQYVRNSLIEMNLSLVQFAASRYKNRGGGDMEDVIQVGTIGLIKAIDRFELTREVEFTSFAIPYIVGEIKRFFRDTSWAVHVPRRLQELRVNLAKAREHLATELGRDAGVAELAQYMEISEDDVIEGMIASNGYTAGSLDMPMDSADEGLDQNSRNYADLIGGRDPDIELFENLNTLAPLLREQLDDRERTLLRMRFGQEMTQSSIGEELGISQMHVSRLLNKTLAKLRTGMLTD
ncbi:MULTISPECIES: SigB/SigF/SigG family RNA polymerase sigma factor [unclassified Streptomyces]|uniref:SigB/SigF/SigG family RNA polymerase sigma factor n=1 Tax=unclassified Streptomyces TaxID=2593676 RepID=UPI002556FCB2|nr:MULTISPECIES: SigB/SigF/SigG family RNA polymerase sigma factor [unclassified Streptomyces]WRZ69084.1 SigB/SigF/SigG family RNA polymerase sigma factor [Streptomyces sp. NBC_01257]WSU63032.1 SigB/SigF/SigG family RNA polymerase sigma factor [Streptomyces sp. NBC_01104]